MTRTGRLLTGCMIAIMATGGCEQPARPVSLASHEKQLAQLRRDNAQLTEQIAEKNRQIETLQQLGDKRIDLLPAVERISLGKHTGPIDTDGKPGHDAIKVFLKPIDADGSVIKAAGSVKISLFDLSADESSDESVDEKDVLIGQCNWPPEELSKQWSSGFIAYHYSLTCPLPHDAIVAGVKKEITVRVEFVDYVTGKTHTAQKLCEVKTVTRD